MGPEIGDIEGPLPPLPRFSWEVKCSRWTDGVGEKLLYTPADEPWGTFHNKSADSNPNKIPVGSDGIILHRILFGRTRHLVQEVCATMIESDGAVPIIIDRIYKRDSLSMTSFVFR